MSTKTVKHTPGPWHVSKSGTYVRYRQSDGTCPNICDVANVFGGPGDECEANARLIAAAPDLFAFAIDQLNATNCICRIQSKLKGTYLESDLECTHCRVKKLLAKAKGESL